MKKSLFTSCLLAASFVTAQAQIKIGDNPTTINANSVLELESNNKGFVPARVALTATNVSAPLSATLLTGTLVYNTATAGSGSTAVSPGYYYWDGVRWVTFAYTDASAIQSILEPVLDNLVTNPTSLTPNDGDAYIVAAGATGAWAGQDNKIAKWDADNATWAFYAPVSGDQTTVASGTNAGTVYQYNGSAWVSQGSSVSSNWKLGGNSNTTATNNVLGTLNSNPLRIYTNGTERMTVTATGQVGIGTNTPNVRLDVMGRINSNGEEMYSGFWAYGAASSSANLCPTFIGLKSRGTLAVPTYSVNGDRLGLLSFRTAQNTVQGASIEAYATQTHTAAASGSSLRFYTIPNGATTQSQRMVIDDNGYVGIGETNPTAPLHIAGTGGNHASAQRIFANNPNGNIWVQNTNSAGNIMVQADGWICTESGFIAYSDARIKKIKGISDSRKDLATLSRIEITDYTKIDAVADKREYKKVIAQQVEQVFPQAVNNTVDYIPNVYETAASVVKNNNETCTISTRKAHGFRTGDQVRMETADKGIVHVPVAVVNAHTFTVAHDFGTDKVFVYGKQVTDFKSVDYEAISMLNVSATQELAKQVEELKKQLTEKNTALQTQGDELSTLKAEVAELKVLFQSAGQAGTVREAIEKK